MKEFLNMDIKCLDVDNNVISILNNNDIHKVKDLWKLKRQDLKNINLSDKEINYIRIKLQLNGIDFVEKIYSRL